MTRRYDLALVFLVTFLATFAVLVSGAVAQVAPSDFLPPGFGASPPFDLAAWWRTGTLAGPIAVALMLALALLRDRVAFLRRGRMRAWISLALSGLAVLLPAAAAGTLTYGGLIVALTGAGVALKPGDGEVKRQPVASGVVEVPHA